GRGSLAGRWPRGRSGRRTRRRGRETAHPQAGRDRDAGLGHERRAARGGWHRRRAHRRGCAPARGGSLRHAVDLSTAMAVLIASSLRKEFAGDPLFEGVSFSVDRKDRLSLAGPNGAGKTTLLRGLAGE